MTVRPSASRWDDPLHGEPGGVDQVGELGGGALLGAEEHQHVQVHADGMGSSAPRWASTASTISSRLVAVVASPHG